VRRRPVFLIVPGRLDTRTGGYEYDRRMVAGLRARGWPVEVRELDGSFPQPTPAALAEASRVLAAIPDGTTVIIDGLALGAMPDEIERERPRLRIVALVHALLAADVGLAPAAVERVEASERRALGAVSLVVVTGDSTGNEVAHYGVPPERIVIVQPGTDRVATSREPLAQRPWPTAERSEPSPKSGEPGTVNRRAADAPPVRLLCVATVNAGKGHAELIRALSMVPAGSWQLTCVGSLARDPRAVDRVQALVRIHVLDDRVSWLGELDGGALEACWARADVFVLATLTETYGMAVAEALARGLPVVSTTTGAIPDMVGTSAGLLVPPHDIEALADALSRVIADAALRARLAEGARLARDRLPTWEEAFDKMSLALERATAGV
jgi:glycosyltransferase involved in cell wall biosynthesis